MTGSTLGVGVIGMSWVAGEHVKAYLANPHCNVVALAGSTASRVAEVAAREGYVRPAVDDGPTLAITRGVNAVPSTNNSAVPPAVPTSPVIVADTVKLVFRPFRAFAT